MPHKFHFPSFVLIMIVLISIAIAGVAIMTLNIEIQSQAITEGRVINKDYRPASAYFNNEYGNYSNERFVVTVEYEGKKAYWWVTEDYYNSVEIGDYVKK